MAHRDLLTWCTAGLEHTRLICSVKNKLLNYKPLTLPICYHCITYPKLTCVIRVTDEEEIQNNSDLIT